jgi:hypothetical protein
MRRSVSIAITGGTTATMLLAVAATSGLAVLPGDEAAPAQDTAFLPVRVPPPLMATPAPPAPVALRDKPIVLPTGAPACGNVMAKYAPPPVANGCGAPATKLYGLKTSRVRGRR